MMKNRIVKKIIAIVFLLFLITGIGGYYFFSTNLMPVDKNGADIVFEVKNGDNVSSVLKRMEEDGIIKSSFVGQIYAKINSLGSLYVGKFEISSAMSTGEILEYISKKSNLLNDDVKITFIEGEWVKHMADKLQEELKLDANSLIELWNNEDYIRSLMEKYPFLTEEIFNDNSRYYLEGYLMPNTYYFDPNSSLETVTEKLLDQTLLIYNKYKSEFENSDLSTHEIFTLASIVQYEASDVDNMKMIAGVFYNRLAINMRLQSSVTVCYAIDIEKGDDWKKCEVNPNYDSPYNTYVVAGLPPGPILNPGESAIEATLNPTDSDYYYFMADVYGDGTVYYAETYAEHQANVNKYLR